MKNIQRGEILKINLNPTQGRQQGEATPCLVLSNNKFNQRRNGIVIISPITNTIKPEIKTLIQLPPGLKVTGSIVAEQIRTLDLNKRWWKTMGIIIEKNFVDSVTHVVSQIVSG